MSSLPKIFLSYSHKDRLISDRIYGDLNKYLDVWRDIEGGQKHEHLQQQIYNQIDKCDKFVLIDSANARGSSWIKREIEYLVETQSLKKKLIILFLDDPYQSGMTGNEFFEKQNEYLSYGLFKLKEDGWDKNIVYGDNLKSLLKELGCQLRATKEYNLYYDFEHELLQFFNKKANADASKLLPLFTAELNQIELWSAYARKSNGHRIKLLINDVLEMTGGCDSVALRLLYAVDREAANEKRFRNQDVVSVLQEAIRINPGDPRPHILIGKHLYCTTEGDVSQLSESIRSYTTAETILQSDPANRNFAGYKKYLFYQKAVAINAVGNQYFLSATACMPFHPEKLKMAQACYKDSYALILKSLEELKKDENYPFCTEPEFFIALANLVSGLFSCGLASGNNHEQLSSLLCEEEKYLKHGVSIFPNAENLKERLNLAVRVKAEYEARYGKVICT